MERQQPLLPRRRVHTFIAPSVCRRSSVTVTNFRLQRSSTVPPTTGKPHTFSFTSDSSETSVEWRGERYYQTSASRTLSADSGAAASVVVLTNNSTPPARVVRRTLLLTCVGAKIHQRRALQRSTPQPKDSPVPLPEPADHHLPPDYIATVHNAIASVLAAVFHGASVCYHVHWLMTLRVASVFTFGCSSLNLFPCTATLPRTGWVYGSCRGGYRFHTAITYQVSDLLFKAETLQDSDLAEPGD
ncbi:hypothetical protein ACOMHN_026781 [Nucella lapillus]